MTDDLDPSDYALLARMVAGIGGHPSSYEEDRVLVPAGGGGDVAKLLDRRLVRDTGNHWYVVTRAGAAVEQALVPEIEVWTDGACDGGGRGGWAFVLTIPDNPFAYHEQSGSVEGTTSQRMEMMALVQALTYVRSQPTWVATFAVHTDSSYLKNCFTQRWWHRWLVNGWVNSRNESVANRDLWEQLLSLVLTSTVRWVKVRGHRGVELNERCDHLAVQARLTLKS